MIEKARRLHYEAALERIAKLGMAETFAVIARDALDAEWAHGLPDQNEAILALKRVWDTAEPAGARLEYRWPELTAAIRALVEAPHE
jgi:hypothetical protein